MNRDVYPVHGASTYSQPIKRFQTTLALDFIDYISSQHVNHLNGKVCIIEVVAYTASKNRPSEMPSNHALRNLLHNRPNQLGTSRVVEVGSGFTSQLQSGS